MRGRPITIEDHQSSRIIADPLHLLDCCLETDGGAAVVITSAERAKNCAHKPAHIMGGAFGAGEWNAQRVVKNVEKAETESTVTGKALFGRAGISHSDVDVWFCLRSFHPAGPHGD